MTLSSVASVFLWTLLIGESVTAVALLFAAVSFRLRHPKRLRHASESAVAILAEMQRVGGGQFSLESRRIVSWIDELKQTASKQTDGFSGVLRYLLSPQAEHAGIESVIALHLGQMERGAIRLCSFLAKTAPLAGLGGTLLGVSDALKAFAAKPGDPSVVIGGFATAIDTTLVGILITFVCLGTSRLIWEPLLSKTLGELMEHALLLKSHLGQLRSKITPTSNGKIPEVKLILKRTGPRNRVQRSSADNKSKDSANPIVRDKAENDEESTNDKPH
jgi:biopolymer transport protein ExbB/TolQ